MTKYEVENQNVNESDELIDVVEEFDYSTQSPEYNESFKKWRKSPSNAYVYNYKKNKKETEFIDGLGYMSTSSAEAEREVLSRCLHLLGAVLLTYILVENIFCKVAISIMESAGLNIHNSFINNSIYGGAKEVVIVLILFNTLKYIIPIYLIHHFLKMPYKVGFPLKLRSASELMYAISGTMIISVVSSISRAYADQTREIYNFFDAYDANVAFFAQHELVIYTFFEVIVVSILSECLFRGEIFHCLRQYGDLFAIIVTSFFSAVITQNFSMMPAYFMISMFSGFMVLRSGTITTAVIIRAIHSLYLLTLTIIESSTSPNMFLTRNFYMSVMFAVGVIIFLIVNSVCKAKIVVMFTNIKTHIKMRSKISLCFQSISLIGALLACIILAITNSVI